MKDKIKIIHICDKLSVSGSSIHGVGRLFSWWFPRFDHEAFDVSLVGLRYDDEATKNLRNNGVDVTMLGRSKFDMRAIQDLLGLIKARRPDILHLHGYGATNLGIVAGLRTRTKIILHEHFVDPHMPFYQVPIDYLIARYVDHAFAVSESVRDFMVRRRHVPQDRIDIVFNGAPLEQFGPRPGAEIERLREQWGIPEGARVIGAIGRLDEQKGFKYLLDAAEGVLGAMPDAYLMIVGDGPLDSELRQQCDETGCSERVIFAGYQDNTEVLQSLFDVQVFPSLWEGTPLTLFEAMAGRRAIVSTDVDGLGEVLEDRETALLVPPRDARLLAAAIEEVLNDPGLQSSLGCAAERESRKYDVQNAIGRFEDVYRGLCQDHAE